METETFERRWHEETEAVVSGLKGWRLQHPKATFDEIEAALDERLAVMRARWLGELALASAASERAVAAAGGCCPPCGGELESRGQQPRTVVTDGDVPIVLRRGYVVCRACGAGFFPPR